ncbi:hypothetical protein TUN199_07318 [Pyrenophora tritici-repentis]|uniref:Uncharacterized protein n=1 Tax=Pyrenophora tritici-repentis TaxID=45151 RepID=A0A5M9L2Z9_9PLEO|nr:hypothetical protein PtrV1_07820 [Pyrenophora tritici-repentis]KAF7571144.1 hypothetical protein PtrM4_111460 [Pyrenophora tritici-repentis]KAI0571498.1 hypothetical protein Alg215_10362 [Pyrenophora tritici-repentis]KAI0578472.1 hypothetical protein Alg130_07936 [Pyrenophora tritici-repentis]KAI0620685.1 hypothetical protein TUN199_07318 [Pyrenophora tritici-repentis]
MQFHLLNVLVVALPFVGSVSAWTSSQAKCSPSPRGPGGDCSAADASVCTNIPSIFRAV